VQAPGLDGGLSGRMTAKWEAGGDHDRRVVITDDTKPRSVARNTNRRSPDHGPRDLGHGNTGFGTSGPRDLGPRDLELQDPGIL